MIQLQVQISFIPENQRLEQTHKVKTFQVSPSVQVVFFGLNFSFQKSNLEAHKNASMNIIKVQGETLFMIFATIQVFMQACTDENETFPQRVSSFKNSFHD